MGGSALDAGPFLRLARAIVDHKGREGATPPPAAPGGRVALAFWRPGAEPVVTTASGGTLADAVAQPRGAHRLEGARCGRRPGRLELDLPTSAAGADRRSREGGAHHGDGPARACSWRATTARRAAVLPGEIIERRLFHDNEGRGATLDRGKVRALLAARAGVDERVPRRDARLPLPRRRARRVGGSRRRAPRLPRHGRAPREADAERLLAAVRRGADYLVRILNAEGRLRLPLPLRSRTATIAPTGGCATPGTTYALARGLRGARARPRTWRRPSSRSGT